MLDTVSLAASTFFTSSSWVLAVFNFSINLVLWSPVNKMLLVTEVIASSILSFETFRSSDKIFASLINLALVFSLPWSLAIKSFCKDILNSGMFLMISTPVVFATSGSVFAITLIASPTVLVTASSFVADVTDSKAVFNSVTNEFFCFVDKFLFPLTALIASLIFSLATLISLSMTLAFATTATADDGFSFNCFNNSTLCSLFKFANSLILIVPSSLAIVLPRFVASADLEVTWLSKLVKLVSFLIAFLAASSCVLSSCFLAGAILFSGLSNSVIKLLILLASSLAFLTLLNELIIVVAFVFVALIVFLTLETNVLDKLFSLANESILVTNSPFLLDT
ncbi:hypothetical protein ACJA23_01920 [Mycoplasma corogypsi]|uniref:hypothetical protein n=1 Tax=Mycoplasma corogypsi TaxID=2106 RepID=UPI00387374D1